MSDATQKRQRMVEELNEALLALIKAQGRAAHIGEDVLRELKYAGMSADGIDRGRVEDALEFADGWTGLRNHHVLGSFEVLRELAQFVAASDADAP